MEQMKNSVNLDITKINKNKFYNVLKTSFILLLIYFLLFIIVIVFNSKEAISSWAVVLYVWLGLMIIASFVRKNYIIVGEAKITNDKIYLSFNDCEYSLVDLVDFAVEFDGYRFQPKWAGRIVTFCSGIDNTISFWYKNKRYNYNFLIKNKKELNELKAFFEE